MTCVRDWFQIHQQALTHKTLHGGQGQDVPCVLLPLTWPHRPWTRTVRIGLGGSEDPLARYRAVHSYRSPSAAWWTSDHSSPTTAIAKPLTKKGPNPSVFPRPLPSASFPHASSFALQKGLWQAGGTDPAATWPWPFALGWGERRQPGDATTQRSQWC